MDQSEDKKTGDQTKVQSSESTENQKDLYEENYIALVEMGFDAELVKKALKLTSDREKAAELIIGFAEDAKVPSNDI